MFDKQLEDFCEQMNITQGEWVVDDARCCCIVGECEQSIHPYTQSISSLYSLPLDYPSIHPSIIPICTFITIASWSAVEWLPQRTPRPATTSTSYWVVLSTRPSWSWWRLCALSPNIGGVVTTRSVEEFYLPIHPSIHPSIHLFHLTTHDCKYIVYASWPIAYTDR